MSNPAATKTAVDAFLAAYNAGDLTALGAALADDVDFHFNRSEMVLKGRDEVIAMFGGIQQQFPDRHFEDGPTTIVADGVAVVDHTWTGTAVVDAPEMGVSAGGVVRQEIVTVFTVRGGLIVGQQDFNYA